LNVREDGPKPYRAFGARQSGQLNELKMRPRLLKTEQE